MTRPPKLEDLPKLPIVGSPTLSPDGKRIAFTTQRWDLEKDRYFHDVWLAPFDDPKLARPVTSGRSSDGAPCFDPSGRYIAFASDRDATGVSPEGKGPKSQNLWLLDTQGGEAVRLTDLPGGVSQFSWSPTGSHIVFIFQPRDTEPPPTHERIERMLEQAGEKLPDGLDSLEDLDEETRNKPNRTPIARHITRLHWREDGRGFLPQARAQIWTLRVDSLHNGGLASWSAAGVADDRLRRLTAGPYDCHQPAVSPDGKWIVFVSNRSKDPDRLSGRYDLWIIPVEGGARGTEETDPTRHDLPSNDIAKLIRVETATGPNECPSWSPDGTRLAYMAHEQPLDLWGITNYEVWVTPVPSEVTPGTSGSPRSLTASMDRTAESAMVGDSSEFSPFSPPVWREASGEILFQVMEGPSVSIYRVHPDKGQPEPLHQMEQAIGGLVGSRDGERLAFAGGTSNLAPEVWTIEGDQPARQASFVTEPWNAEVGLSLPQYIPVPVADEGHEVDAWLLKPPDFDPKKKYPLLLQIHGGPAAAYGHTLHFEMQWLAAQGYCVLYTNPRGSQGYGFEFGAAIRQDLAAPAHRDMMAAIDLVASREYIDEDRMGITGGSWGGYMTNWVITQTDRFRAALAQRSICDFESDFGASDFGYEVEWMFGGPPWTHREVYQRCSPLTYVENVRTPLLLIHSEEDWRCPPMQAEQMFMALKVLGREVEMIRFPNEPHGLSRSGTPSRRLARLRIIRDYFARHLLAEDEASRKKPAQEAAARA